MIPGSMVGRAAEVAELAGAWTALVGAHPVGPRAAVLTGAAGVGKSTLVSVALAALSPAPRTVLRGSARLHSPAPYDWLAAVLAGCQTGDLPVPGPALAWLGQHPDVPRERYAPDALLRLAVRAVRALAGHGPAVLVVEDLHALDPASLNLVGELATVPDLGALLLVTSRLPDDAVSPHLTARVLARLSGTPGAVRQHLGPLPPDDVAALLARAYPGHPADPGLAAAVWERTGGNPYRFGELVAMAGAADPAALLRAPLPDHLRLTASPAGPGPAAVPGQAAGPGPAAVPGQAPGELTARESQVLDCLAAGMSNKQVARALGISVRTVTVHVSNLLRKTGSASRTEAALWAVRRGAVTAAAGPPR
ncbi:MAG TPA: LuxR family transcriptional regulator [Pilimelia sp.]|nr:LuxR family transcriptional regulator [Pilimelia sp.]